MSSEKGRDLIALDDALTALAAVDARKSEVVELRFFGGLSVAETAEAFTSPPDRDARLETRQSLAPARARRRSDSRLTAGGI